MQLNARSRMLSVLKCRLVHCYVCANNILRGSLDKRESWWRSGLGSYKTGRVIRHKPPDVWDTTASRINDMPYHVDRGYFVFLTDDPADAGRLLACYRGLGATEAMKILAACFGFGGVCGRLLMPWLASRLRSNSLLMSRKRFKPADQLSVPQQAPPIYFQARS